MAGSGWGSRMYQSLSEISSSYTICSVPAICGMRSHLFAPLEMAGELQVVQAEQLQDGRVQVVHMHLVLDGVKPQLIRPAGWCSWNRRWCC